jgi:hypothetical protein
MPHPNDLGHGRLARMVFRKTGETPVPPGLCRPSYFPNHTRRARVQGLPTKSIDPPVIRTGTPRSARNPFTSPTVYSPK